MTFESKTNLNHNSLFSVTNVKKKLSLSNLYIYFVFTMKYTKSFQLVFVF